VIGRLKAPKTVAYSRKGAKIAKMEENSMGKEIVDSAIGIQPLKLWRNHDENGITRTGNDHHE